MPDQEHPPKDHQLKAPETPQFREMPPDVQKILDAHQQWVKTEGKEGQKADLRGADLQGLDLFGVNLKGANLAGANLTGANLWGTYLAEAHLL